MPQKLFIPGKNMPEWKQPAYGTDMRAIENYINNLPTGGGIQEITSTLGGVHVTNPTGPITDLETFISGDSSVTVLPSGLPNPTPGDWFIEVNLFSVGCSMFTNGWAVNSTASINLNDEAILLPSNKNGSLIHTSTIHLGATTLMKANTSNNCANLPVLEFPNFSAGTITADSYVTITDATIANAATWRALGLAGSSGGTVNTTASQYSLLNSVGGAFSLSGVNIRAAPGTVCQVEAVIVIHYSGLVP